MTSPGIGILTWRATETLERTLLSHAEAELGIMAKEKVVFVQEGDPEGVKIAKSNGYRVDTSDENLGILGGFEALARSMTSEFIIINENDFQVSANPEETKEQLETAYRLLNDGTAKIVLLRSRTTPGAPFALKVKHQQFHPPENAVLSTKLAAFARRTLRPQKARNLRARSIRFDENAHLIAPKEVTQIMPGWNLTTSRWQPWTNNPFMIERAFFLNTIIPFAKAAKTRRRTNGFKNLEVELNCNWWRESEFPIAQGPGLFTHNRIGYRGY